MAHNPESSVPPQVVLVTGMSGAGKSLKEGSLYCSVNEGISAYATGTHRHQAEMGVLLGSDVFFSPQAVPMNRGILSAIYVDNDDHLKKSDVMALYNEAYADEPFVRVFDHVNGVNTRQVAGSNYCFIWIDVISEEKIVIFSAIDNLIKGASGLAIQNMNIMLGFDETDGLTDLPLSI